MNEKLLSHRLRGLAGQEQSAKSFSAISKYSIPYYEIDTRVSKDGEIFVHHDPWLVNNDGKRYRISNLNGVEIRAYAEENNSDIVDLKTALGLFSANANPGVTLCVDIKDYGFEKRHCDLISQNGLIDRVSIVSWIPQTVLKMSKVCRSNPLILSCLLTRKYPLFTSRVSNALQNKMIRFGDYIILGNSVLDPLQAKYHKGYQYSLFSHVLDPSIINILADSGGGICVPTWLCCDALYQYCSDNSLELWIFTVNNSEEYDIFKNLDQVSVIFSDNAINLCESNS